MDGDHLTNSNVHGTTGSYLYADNNSVIQGDVSLFSDYDLPNGKTLTIKSGKFTIPSGKELGNDGTINNWGEIINNGEISGSLLVSGGGTTNLGSTFKNYNKITNNGTIVTLKNLMIAL